MKKATDFGELLLWVVHKDTNVLFPACVEENKKGIIVENAVSYLTLQSVSATLADLKPLVHFVVVFTLKGADSLLCSFRYSQFSTIEIREAVTTFGSSLSLRKRKKKLVF